MGKVLKKLSEIRQTPTLELIERFKHIVGAKAIREYLASKPDRMLDTEVRMTGEELVRRTRTNQEGNLVLYDKETYYGKKR